MSATPGAGLGTDERDAVRLAGRDAELARLLHHRDEARAGRPRTLVLEGRAGIGKTALIGALVAASPGFQVVRASGDAAEAGLAYGILDQLARTAGATGPALIGDGRHHTVGAGLGLLQLLGRLQDDGPVLLVVDDLQWADHASLRALLFALRRLVADAVLAVLSIREADAERLPEGIGRLTDGARGEWLRLGPLTPEAIAELALGHGVRLSPRAVRRLHEHTRGCPQASAALIEELPAATWLQERPLPAPRALAAGVAAQLAGCTPAARDLVEAAAVHGEPAPLATLAALAGIEAPFAALDEALAAGLLRLGDAEAGRDVTFPTPTTRAAVYDGLGAGRRAALHAAAAELAADEAQALRHRVAASPGGDDVLAAALDAQAAREAARGAWSNVGDALLGAAQMSTAAEERARRLLAAADAFVFAGDMARAAALADELKALPGGPGRDAVLGHVAQYGAAPHEAETLLRRAWSACDTDAEPAVGAGIARSLAMHSMLRLDATETVAWAERSLALAGAAADGGVRALASGVLALGRMLEGRYDEAERVLRAARAEVPADNGLPLDALLAWLRLGRDDVAGARALLAGIALDAARIGSYDIAALTHATRARAGFLAGAWDDAAGSGARAAAIVRDFEHVSVRSLARWAAVLVPAARGEWAAADALVRAIPAPGDTPQEGRTLGALTVATVAAARQQHDEVLRALEPLTRAPRGPVAEPALFPWPELYAEALVATGRLGPAAAFLPAHEALAEERGVRSAQLRLARVRGRLEAAQGRPERAERAFQSAVEAADALALPFDRALSEHAYGQFLRRQGRRRAAAEVLGRAQESFVALGAAPYVERGARELEACGLAPAKRGAMDREDLTPQERSVAGLVASGLTNREVAAELVLSVKTVEVHLTRIYAKLGVKSRRELAGVVGNPS